MKLISRGSWGILAGQRLDDSSDDLVVVLGSTLNRELGPSFVKPLARIVERPAATDKQERGLRQTDAGPAMSRNDTAKIRITDHRRGNGLRQPTTPDCKC